MSGISRRTISSPHANRMKSADSRSAQAAMGDEDSFAEGGLPKPRLGIGRDAGSAPSLVSWAWSSVRGTSAGRVSTTGKPNCSAMR